MSNFSVVRIESASTVSIYPNYIPDFVTQALDTLYGNLHASLATLKLHSLGDASTYVKWRSPELQPESIFLFEKLDRLSESLTKGCV